MASHTNLYVSQLMDMGFSKNRAERAVLKTGFKNSQVAMDWIFAHEDDPDIDDQVEFPDQPEGQTLGDSSSSADAESQAIVRSMKCDVCSKLLKSTDVEFHAAKTGHTQFSQSEEEVKQLTEEELEQQVKVLDEKLSKKRQEREESDAKEKLEKEKLRRNEGRNLGKWRDDIAQEDLKREAEARRREKDEQKAYLKRIRENYERDRAELECRNSVSVPVQQKPSLPEVPHVRTDTCKLHIRLTHGGQPLQSEFKSKETLAVVMCYVRTQCPELEHFTLMTPFPRRVFSEDDMGKPLESLDLCPSAVLQVTKLPNE